MNLRWKIERNIYDYFNADSDPVLQIHTGEDWVTIPRIVIENDRRVHKDESSKKISISEVIQTNLPKMPKYPNTTNQLVTPPGQMDLYDLWQPVPL